MDDDRRMRPPISRFTLSGIGFLQEEHGGRFRGAALECPAKPANELHLTHGWF